ncbi:MAG: hypothetical protein JWN52_2256 [Actinomycetia bacterium]|nr:hypothetical protein [Actinomycetes bacterium]
MPSDRAGPRHRTGTSRVVVEASYAPRDAESSRLSCRPVYSNLWDQFAALLPARAEFAPTHPLGCHRRRIPDQVVFEHVVQALVHGSGYERISSPGCSDRTIRRRLKLWAQIGIAQQIHALAREAHDRMIGLGLNEISVDGCITKAPSGGDKAGRSPVDRGKQGLKRSVASDAAGVPLGIVSADANRHDSPLLGPPSKP